MIYILWKKKRLKTKRTLLSIKHKFCIFKIKKKNYHTNHIFLSK